MPNQSDTQLDISRPPTPPYHPGEYFDLIYYNSSIGTIRERFIVTSCRLFLPSPSVGLRWNLTYERNGEVFSIVVDHKGFDRYKTVSPVNLKDN